VSHLNANAIASMCSGPVHEQNSGAFPRRSLFMPIAAEFESLSTWITYLRGIPAPHIKPKDEWLYITVQYKANNRPLVPRLPTALQ
jgi:hypothetical protein